MKDYLDDAHVLGIGTVLNGHFRVQGILGAGGFGITYRAADQHLDRMVAIKEFYPGAWVSRNTTQSAAVIPVSARYELLFASMKEKFIEEAKAMAKLDSLSHVVKVYSYFEENGTAYIVMEFLEGVTLKRHIEDHGKMDPDELCRLMIPLIRALHVVHGYRLIHRDIAPDNIMLMQDRTLKLMDFGAARSFSDDAYKSMSVILKHGFAPFEQYQRHGNQGAWTDVYGLSATIYYCITGIIPEPAADRVAKDHLKRPSEIGIPLRPALEEALMKGMEKLEEDRYQTAMDMANAYDEAMLGISGRAHAGPGGTVVVEEPVKEAVEEKRDAERPAKEETGEKNDTPKEPDRKPHRAKLLAILVMTLVLGGAGIAILNRNARREPPEITTAPFVAVEATAASMPSSVILSTELPTDLPASPTPYTSHSTETVASTTELTDVPTSKLTITPTAKPTSAPTVKPTGTPTVKLTGTPTIKPTSMPVSGLADSPAPKPEPTFISTSISSRQETPAPTVAATVPISASFLPDTDKTTASPNTSTVSGSSTDAGQAQINASMQPYSTPKATVWDITTAPLNVKLSLDKKEVKDGEQITAGWTVSGGTPPYKLDQVLWVKLDKYGDFTGQTEGIAAFENDKWSSVYVPKGHERGSCAVYMVDAKGERYGVAETYIVLGSVSDKDIPLALSPTVEEETASAQETPAAAEAVNADQDLDQFFGVGKEVSFGAYEQDNNRANGKEPIQWRVLLRDDNKALLISVDNLDCQPYNTVGYQATWEASSLRRWLNDSFMNTAFTLDQQKGIISVEMERDTEDKIFLLSAEEVERLFKGNSDRIARNSAYARAQGALERSFSYYSNWSLRSPDDGEVDSFGNIVEYDKSNDYVVRPALLLDLSVYLSLNLSEEDNSPMATEMPEKVVWVPSGLVEELVRQAAGLDADTPITNRLLANVTELDLSSCDLGDIQFLEAFKGLEILNLKDDQIEDIRPLADLTKLQVLNMESNRIRDVSPLSGLKALKVLNLAFNEIREFSYLFIDDSLAKLEKLYLEGNPLKNHDEAISLKALKLNIDIFDAFYDPYVLLDVLQSQEFFIDILDKFTRIQLSDEPAKMSNLKIARMEDPRYIEVTWNEKYQNQIYFVTCNPDKASVDYNKHISGETRAVFGPLLPNTNYEIQVSAINSSKVLKRDYKTPAAKPFFRSTDKFIDVSFYIKGEKAEAGEGVSYTTSVRARHLENLLEQMTQEDAFRGYGWDINLGIEIMSQIVSYELLSELGEKEETIRETLCLLRLPNGDVQVLSDEPRTEMYFDKAPMVFWRIREFYGKILTGTYRLELYYDGLLAGKGQLRVQ